MLHAATQGSLDHVDFVEVDEEAFEQPLQKQEHGDVPALRAAHHTIVDMDDAAKREALARRLIERSAVRSRRVRKEDAKRVVAERLTADPSLETLIDDRWKAPRR